MKTFDFRVNSLNLFRLLAALQVAYGHMVCHLKITDLDEISVFINYLQGVPVFFILSGYLIWESVGNSKSFNNYLTKRFWRIYPELWLAVGLEIIVMIMLYDISSICDLLIFSFTQASIFQFWTPDSLRGYGCGTPNGALWTICVLIQFYILVYGIRKLLHNSSIWLWLVFFITSIMLGKIPYYLPASLPEIFGKLYSQTIFNYLYLFVAGIFLSEYKDTLIIFLKKYWHIPLVASIALYIGIVPDSTDLEYPLAKSVTMSYAAIGFAYAFPKLNIKTDISYGIYIYHMTIVNAFITFSYIGSWIYMVAAIGVSTIIAYSSTKIVKNLGQLHALFFRK